MRHEWPRGSLDAVSGSPGRYLLDYGLARQIVALFFNPMETLRAQECDTLMESGPFGLFTYLPHSGFMRMSRAALDLFNRTPGLKLSLDDILNRRLQDLPLPRHIIGLDTLLRHYISNSPRKPHRVITVSYLTAQKWGTLISITYNCTKSEHCRR